MITRSNGNRYRNDDTDVTELEGFTLQGRDFIQNFLPCKHRVIRSCPKCPVTLTSKSTPTCTKKNILKYLNCVGCSERES